MDGTEIGLAPHLFHPGSKHVEDERQRLGHNWVIEGGRGKGCGPIDLDSGTVTLAGPDVEAVLPERPRTEETTAEDDEGLPEV